ncbi:hypothetical protein FKR81_12970 [Lentzea tibetensis]|uniref:Uncharacterized protein n=1 Tax=Lentzea tibetensis TaxID=2591470 RepID=A0A563EWB4_9PSEU|nr:ankyrin repeat domain-containing protein [Lentzea tibetensis]TWP51771.1 hypothetical protein FKR81_12970 [Lentzea tibetensis]
MKDVDWFSPFVVRGDAVGVESARDEVTPEVLEDLLWLYGRLDTWLQRCLLVQLLQDHWEPELFAPVMRDMLRAPTDWHDGGTEDNVQWSQAVALGFLDERYDMFDRYWNDRDVLRAAVARARTEYGLTADEVADAPRPLIPYSADPKARLEQACRRGDTDIVLATLDTGLDVDTPLSIGTPMMHAIVNGHVDTGLRLLERGASASARWKYTGATALIKAGYYGSVPLADALLARGVSPDEADDDGLTALYFAANYGYLDVLRRLLQAGASPRAARSPLVAAAGGGHVDVVQALLAAGSELEEVAWGRTGLGTAAMLNQAPAVDFLIEAGAHVDARDDNGRTPLMQAAVHGYPRIVERLLRAGADRSLVDNAGKTARDLIRPRRREELTALLADPPKPVVKVPKNYDEEHLGIKFSKETDRSKNGSWPCAATECSGQTKLLVALRHLYIPHGMEGHNNAFCYTFVAVCTTCGTGRLESFSHDCWSYDDPWDLAWVHVVAPEDVERLRTALRDCPRWEDAQCDCTVHAALLHSAQRLGPSTPATVELVDGGARFQRRQA